jgi:TonB family protein
MAHASASAGFLLNDEWQADFTRRLGRAVAVSLAVHLAVLVAVAWVRLPKHGERPLTSIEISLASVPALPAKPVEPPKRQPELPKSQPKPVELPKPAPPVKMAPMPIPVAPTPVPVVPAKPSNDVMRDVMKDIELPPDAPQFGDISPTEKPKKTQLKLPEIPVASEMKEPVRTVPESKPQPSLAEDVNKALDEEFKKLKKFEIPKPAPPEAMPKPVPQVEAKIPSMKAVDATLKVPGMTPGSNAYLGRVRQRISSFWSAPPVDVTGQTYVVIVQFRLHRNGSVTGVAIEQSSGNEYYDLAGKRAVLGAVPLPAFPPELTELYFDAHFTFTVGESHG